MTGSDLIDQLKKLWVLELVVRRECFQTAAAELKVTRSAVSQTVSQLEKIHGKVLLVRERGTVRPTAYCVELLEKARPLWSALEGIRPTAQEAVPRMSWLDIGAYESLAIEIMPRLLQRLEEHCPGVRVSVKIARSGKLATMVRKGELCMAIVVENDLLGGLTVIPLVDDRLGLYVAAREAGAMPPRKLLTTLPLGTLSAGPDGQPGYLTKFLKEAALTRTPSFTSDSFEALLEAAVYGSIAAVLPYRVAQRKGPALVEVTPRALIDRFAGRHRLCLVSRRNCDEGENQYLAREIKALLTIPPVTPFSRLLAHRTSENPEALL